MKKLLQIIPVPICGLILGLASLGNLFKQYNYFFIGNIFGVIAAILLTLIILKILFTFDDVKKSLKDPIIASTSPTFTMSIMVLCTYLVAIDELQTISKFIWMLAVVGQYALATYFIYNFVIKEKLKIENLYPSWFVIFVGIGVISVTSSKFILVVGQVSFLIGLFFYAILLPIVIYRVFIVKNMPNPTLPLITIMAAPGALETTGYLNAFEHPNKIMVLVLLIISQITYWVVVSKVVRMIKLPFYPSYAAFTFPLVINAIAIASANVFINNCGLHFEFIDKLALVELVIALGAVIYVLCRYLNYLVNQFIGDMNVSLIKNS
ncbi:exfoliative toxin A/B [Bacilli bacterium PM5-9]|nr:exfoliative toxin A/B [Bacilli bacterium PM5-9]